MSKVIVKTVNRKTTIPKAVIRKAAAIAYGLKPGIVTVSRSAKPGTFLKPS